MTNVSVTVLSRRDLRLLDEWKVYVLEKSCGILAYIRKYMNCHHGTPFFLIHWIPNKSAGPLKDDNLQHI